MNEGRNVFQAAKSIQIEVSNKLGPPEVGRIPATSIVIPKGLVRGTRGYIVRVTDQINGTYENGWYDACAVMMRRLLETLIIEVYEKYQISDRIKNNVGDFFYLSDLIDKCLNETAWNLSRNCKKAMPKLKDIGDKSAHNRRFNANKPDVELLLADVRMVVQELLYLAGLK